jgi:hypothetical protein
MKEEIVYNEQTVHNRKEGIEHTIEFLDRTGVFEVCADDKKKREVLDNLTREQALSFLERVNGILIGLPIDDREALEYSSNVIRGDTKEVVYMPVDNKDLQEQVIDKQILPALKELDLDDAAIYAATCINLLHMFPEGNGRLGRLINFMFCSDNADLFAEEGFKMLRRILVKRGGVLNCDPSLIEPEVKDIIEERVRGEDFKDTSIHFIPLKREGVNDGDITISNVSRQYFETRAQIDAEDFNLGIIAYLSRNKADVDSFKKDDGLEIDIDVFLNSVQTREQLIDLYISYQSIKTLRYKIFTQLFTSPQKFQTENGMTLKELFESRIVSVQVQHYKELTDAFEPEK